MVELHGYNLIYDHLTGQSNIVVCFYMKHLCCCFSTVCKAVTWFWDGREVDHFPGTYGNPYT